MDKKKLKGLLMVKGTMDARKCNKYSAMTTLNNFAESILDNLRNFKNISADKLASMNNEELDKMLKDLNYLQISLVQYGLLDYKDVDAFEVARDVIKKFFTLYNLKTSKINKMELRRVEKEIAEMDVFEMFSGVRRILLEIDYDTLINKVFFARYVMCWLDAVGDSDENQEVYKVLNKAFKEHKYCYIGRIGGGWIKDVEKSVIKYLSRRDIKLMTFRDFIELESLGYCRRIYFICFTDRELDEVNLKETDRIELMAYLKGKVNMAIFFKYT